MFRKLIVFKILWSFLKKVTTEMIQHKNIWPFLENLAGFAMS